MAPDTGIISFVMRGISQVEQNDLRVALIEAYQSRDGTEAARQTQHVFGKLTSSRWNTDILCRFLSGWYATHGTALYVSGLIVRLGRIARGASAASKPQLFAAIDDMNEVIAEDTGVDDLPHNELFDCFATTIVGDDRWRLNQFRVPECEQFRHFIKRQRLASPLEDAILTTAASESWNSGEYSHFETILGPWLSNIIGCPAASAKTASAYVSVHAGNTELGHFLYAIRAWQRYAEALGIQADAPKAKEVFSGYLSQILTAYRALDKVLT